MSQFEDQIFHVGWFNHQLARRSKFHLPYIFFAECHLDGMFESTGFNSLKIFPKFTKSSRSLYSPSEGFSAPLQDLWEEYLQSALLR